MQKVMKNRTKIIALFAVIFALIGAALGVGTAVITANAYSVPASGDYWSVETVKGPIIAGYDYGKMTVNGQPLTLIVSVENGDCIVSSSFTGYEANQIAEWHLTVKKPDGTVVTIDNMPSDLLVSTAVSYRLNDYMQLDQTGTYAAFYYLVRINGAVMQGRPIPYCFNASTIAVFEYGSFIELPPDPVKTGYTFAGWYFDEAFTQAYDGRPIYADTALYARFDPINYGISYTLNGGSLSGQQTNYTIESASYTLPSPSQNGYTFAGWHDNGGFSGNAVAEIASGSTGNRNYYAKWNAVEYGITYHLNGGELSGAATTYTVEQGVTLKAPTKNGYGFDGWYTADNFNGAPVTEIPQGSTGEKAFYAKFTPVPYAIAYHVNDGVLSGQQTQYTIESGYTLPTPTREGYRFLGWYASGGFSGSAVGAIPQGSTGDKAFYAKWEMIVYTVTFYVDGAVYREMQVPHATVLNGIQLLNAATMRAVSLFADEGHTVGYNSGAGIFGDTVVFAESGFDLYCTLTFSVNGDLSAPLTLDYNAPLSEQLYTPEPSEGFTFDGWYYDGSFIKPVGTADRLTSNTVLYAKFTEIPPPSAGQKVGAFFVKWWWAFAVPVAVVGVAFIVKAVKKRRKKA